MDKKEQQKVYEMDLKYAKPCYKVKLSTTKRNAFIFDVDGTLSAKAKDRGIFDGSKAHKDKPIIPVILLLEMLRDNLFDILIVSGRGENDRKVTERWLNKYSLEYDELFMRAEKDYRPDDVVKREIYEREIKRDYNVIAVFDDRPKVLKLWQELGLFTFNVNQDVYCIDDF